MLGLTIHTTADDIAKRLSFLTLGFIVTDAHFNKGGFGGDMQPAAADG